MTVASITPSRQEISSQDQWNLDVMYPSLNEWQKNYSRLLEKPSAPFWPSFQTFKGHLNGGPQVVRDLLEKYFQLTRELEKLYTYAHLRHDEEITITSYKEAFQKISSTLHDFSQETSWIEPELLSLHPETLDIYLSSKELAPYRFYLEKIVRLRAHTLSEEQEALLAMAGKPLQSTSKAFSAFNNADLKFSNIQDSQGKELPLSHGLYQVYLRSPDRTLRKNAFLEMHKQFLGMENTLTELIYGEVQQHVFNARARHYDSSLDAALFPKQINADVYRSLIKAVREQGLPSLHRYIKLRKKVLNLSEIHPYDLYVPLVEQVKFDFPYDDAEHLVIDSVAPLGADYQAKLRKGLLEERWVDRYENVNKRSGAYSSGCYDSYPYILMNYRGTLKDLFTLAHEAGHSMHSLLSHESQPYHDSQYPIFLAEVASTFNEQLLHHLLSEQRTKKEEQLYLVNEKIEEIRTTLFRQVMFAEFELMIHEFVEKGTPLTPQLLKDTYYQLNADYFGPEMVLDPEIAIEWARIPHFYYNFYVFQYATGISAAIALSQRVLNAGDSARNDYLTFLKAGGSRYPLDILKSAGIDMTSPAPVQAALKQFDSHITEMEKFSSK